MNNFGKKVCEAIDERKNELIFLSKKILRNPELGFKEEKTAGIIKEQFEKMGIKYEDKLAVTGVKGKITGKRSSPVVAILGEMDAVISPMHPYADKTTSAAHACGHNAMLANLIGVGFGLVDSGVIKELDGSVVLFAVPAEEYIDIEFRRKLMERGKIELLGGKQELIRLGKFEDIDLAIMYHPIQAQPRTVFANVSYNGFIGKTVRYSGKEAHAGAEPEKGVNALSAAMLGLQGIHGLRETFKDEDCVRVHPIIKKGGDGVNVVPSDVRIESYVRAKTISALTEVNERVNRALRAGALAIGCNIEINNMPGYVPLIPSEVMTRLFADNSSVLVDKKNVKTDSLHLPGSSDMGDVTQIIPGIQPLVGGFEGGLHSKDFKVVDEEMAYIIPAKIMAMTVVDLLKENAKLAKKASEEKKMTRKEYLNQIKTMRKTTKKEYMVSE